MHACVCVYVYVCVLLIYSPKCTSTHFKDWKSRNYEDNPFNNKAIVRTFLINLNAYISKFPSTVLILYVIYKTTMIYTHKNITIRILWAYNCFLLCFKSSRLCKLYHLKRMSFPVKQIKCEQQKCEAANQNCTYKLSCGIDVRKAIIGKNGIDIMLYHIVIFFIALADYGVYRHFQQYFSCIVGTSSIGRGNRSNQRKPQTCRN